MHPRTYPLAPKPAPKLTLRHERFCQAFVLYANAATAACEAGYQSKWARKQGYRLMRTARIRARIQEIQVQMARDHGRDLDVLIGKLEVVYRRAIGDHHFTAAARAVELQARLGGKIVRDMPQIIEEAEKGAALDSGAGQKAGTEIEQ